MTETALIIIPEEAELCLPLLHDSKESFTHLLTYAAPVTRKMLHFNDLTYYAVPALPMEWKPPTWLITELGIFAGRLYFDFDEYDDLLKYLGFQEHYAVAPYTTNNIMSPSEAYEQDREGQEMAAEQEMNKTAQRVQSFTAKPLTFLHEWLAVRRKGQDFTHTPMGHVCQGKPLTESHPFFTTTERNGILRINDTVGVGSAQRGEENEEGSADDDTTSDQDLCEDDGYSGKDEERNGMASETEPSEEDGSVGDDGKDADWAMGSPALSFV